MGKKLEIYRARWDQWKKWMNEEGKKTIKIQKVDKLEINNINLGLFIESTFSCRAPSPIYNMYSKEKYLIFQRVAIMTRKLYEIISLGTFLEAYYAWNNKRNKLLCDLYPHNILLHDDPIWKPNHFLGDAKLRYFLSYLNKDTHWSISP